MCETLLRKTDDKSFNRPESMEPLLDAMDLKGSSTKEVQCLESVNEVNEGTYENGDEKSCDDYSLVIEKSLTDTYRIQEYKVEGGRIVDLALQQEKELPVQSKLPTTGDESVKCPTSVSPLIGTMDLEVSSRNEVQCLESIKVSTYENVDDCEDYNLVIEKGIWIQIVSKNTKLKAVVLSIFLLY